LPSDVHIGRRPVVHDGRIVNREVVVTPDQPLGIWHVDGAAMAPLLRAVRSRPSCSSAEDVLRRRLRGDGPRAAEVVAWMRGQGWID
jgi:hypothetical protein